jgi:hypothetical protein
MRIMNITHRIIEEAIRTTLLATPSYLSSTAIQMQNTAAITTIITEVTGTAAITTIITEVTGIESNS